MSDLDEILQRKLEALEDGTSPRKVVKGLKGEAAELEPLIQLAAAMRELPQPELSPETSRAMQKELIKTARETLKLPARKPAPSLAWLWTPGFASLSLVILVLALVFFGGRLWLAGPSAARTVLLSELSGQVQVSESAKADWKPASVGLALRSGQAIRTQANSSAVLRFFDGTRTILAPNTELVLDKIGGDWGNVLKVKLSQAYGFTSHRVVPFGAKQSSFSISTAAGSARVHGTEFTVGSMPGGKAYFAVESGQVVVSNQKGDVTLAPGQATALLVDQPPEPPAYTFTLTDTLVLADGNTWWIGGVPFQITPDTLLLDELQAGDTVMVVGRILENGRWVIDSVQPARAAPKKFMFAGVVQEMGADTWLINGISVQVNLATRLLDSIQLGNVVKVKYVILSSGSWQALEISTLVAGKLPPTATLTSSPPPAESSLFSEAQTPWPSPMANCFSAEPKPEAATLAERYSVPVGEIMGWFCMGFGFGEIDQVYSLRTESVTVEQIFAERIAGQGMGEIKKEFAPETSPKNQPVKPEKPANENKPANSNAPEKESKPTKTPKP